ncbi:MAG: branched-chain amino acid ABC transporter permease [Parvibaculaceae bacterium]
MIRTLRSLWPVLVPAAIVVVLTVILATSSPVMARVVTDALIKMTIVIGLYVFIGQSGIVSFGHGGFLVIAAYVSAWLTIPPQFKKIILPEIPIWLQQVQFHPLWAAIAAAAIATVIALIIGLALMRLAGIAASIATFAFLNVIVVIYNNWTSWTKGTASLVGLPIYVGPYTALACAIIAMLVAFAFQSSRWGMMLRATREDPVAARAAGISIVRMRLVGFVVSVAIVAVGGLLQGHFSGALTTSANVYLNLTFLTLTMLIVGGMRSLAGAVTGVILVAAISEILRQFERGVSLLGMEVAAPSGFGQVALGVILLLVLLLRPRGLLGGRDIPFPGRLFNSPATRVEVERKGGFS